MNRLRGRSIAFCGWKPIGLTATMVLGLYSMGWSRADGACFVFHHAPNCTDTEVRSSKQPAAWIAGLADEATRALRSALWDGQVQPVISGLGELPTTELIRVLVEPIPPAPRSAWHTLRAGYTGDSPSDESLDAMRALLIREALLAALDADVQLPPSVLSSMVDALPRPVRNPGATDVVTSLITRLERRGRLSGVHRSDAIAVCAQWPDERAKALAWVTRLDALYAALLMRADGAEGRAIVRISRASRLANAGWDYERDSSIDRPSERSSVHASGKTPADPNESTATTLPSTYRPLDRVLRDIRQARKDSPRCESLVRVLRETRPSAVMVVSSVVIDAHDQLGVGRQVVALDEERLAVWFRESGAMPISRAGDASGGGSARGTTPSTRSRPKRLRDAPFGVKPLG